MEKEFIDTLRAKEKDILRSLKETSLFKQWESIKTTIAMFEGNSSPAVSESDLLNMATPREYDQNFTWAEKILYAVDVLGSGFVADLVKEIAKHDEEDEGTIHARISGVISQMIKGDKLQIIQKSGKRIKVARK